jgi:hypothetical protein
LLLVVVNQWLLKQEMGVWARTLVLLLIIGFAPLPMMIVSGMEHTLQCLFAFLFLSSLSDWLKKAETGTNSRGLPWTVVVYGVLVTAIRYEGLFLIAIGCCILLLRRKVAAAFLLGITACILIFIFGAYSISKGSYFLPNSVLMKSDGIHMSLRGILSFISNTLIYKLSVVSTQFGASGAPGVSLLASQRLLMVLPLVYLLFYQRLKQDRYYSYFLGMLIVCVLIHLCFAATGWFYRYEAYLMVCSILIVSVIVSKYGRELIRGRSPLSLTLAGLLLFMICFPFLLRSAAAYTKAKRACINIYDQQYQMAQFLHRYYDRDTVAANDIGAISFYGNLNVVDLWGLGSIDVARSRKGGYWTPVFLDSLVRSRGVKLAIVYETWFDKPLLDKWTKVATWQMPQNVICGSDVVTFYTIQEADKKTLEDNLHSFQLSLPRDISVVYY